MPELPLENAETLAQPKSAWDYIELLKKERKIESDYGIAKLLNVSKTTVSNYRNRGSTFSPRILHEIADMLDTDAAVMAVEMRLEMTASDKRDSMTWLRVYRRLVGASDFIKGAHQVGFANVSLMLSIAIVLIATLSPTVRAAVIDGIGAVPSLYIMLN